VDNGSSVWLHGTHLITFNESAAINESLLVMYNFAKKRTPGVASSPSLNITISQDVINIPYHHGLSERNLEYSQQFGAEINTNRTHQVVLFFGTVICALICVSLAYQQFTRTRRPAVQLREVIAQVGRGRPKSRGGVVN